MRGRSSLKLPLSVPEATICYNSAAVSAIGWPESLAHDLRYTARSLRRGPMFTTVAVLTLAIGIGATTALFSTVNATLLRPLPYPHAEQLVSVRSRLISGQVTSGLLSPLNLGVLNDRQLPVEHVTGLSATPQDGTLVGPDGAPVNVLITGVTEGFFEMLGLPMAVGPGFTHDDFVPSGPGAPTAIVISNRVWTTAFGRDPSIVGRNCREGHANRRTPRQPCGRTAKPWMHDGR